MKPEVADTPASEWRHEQWAASYPELTTRPELLAYMASDANFAAVVMGCMGSLMEGPHYLKGYKLGDWCLDQVKLHTTERVSTAAQQLSTKLPTGQWHIIRGQAISLIKNVWKNAARDMGRNTKVIFGENDYVREESRASKIPPRRARNLGDMLRKFPTCVYCNCGLTKFNATVDHVIPLDRGGGDGSHMNRVLACGQCNNRKANAIWMPKHVTDDIRERREFQKLIDRIGRMSLRGGL